MRVSLLLFVGALCLIVPFKSIAGGEHKESIYGDEDARVEISAVKDPKIVELSHAVVLITYDDWLESASTPETYKSKYLNRDVQPDGISKDSRKFINQASAGFCTGFLVDDTHLMTAGHCIDPEDSCDKLRFVFDYVATDQPSSELMFPEIPEKNIKTCKSFHKSESDADFSIIELSEPQTDRPHFTLTSATEKPTAAAAVTMLGHPDGKPMKFVDGAEVLQSTDDSLPILFNLISSYEFVTNLDAFHGNSGSPVLNASNEVVGILVSGAQDDDYEKNEVMDHRYPKYPTVKDINRFRDFMGERVTSIAMIQNQLAVLK